MRTLPSLPGVVGPYPRHAQTKAAEKARQAVREARAHTAATAVSEGVIGRPLPPWRRIGVEQLPSAALAFARAAEKAGLIVAARAAGTGIVQVGVAHENVPPGYRPVLWMRATWRRPGVTWVSDGVTLYGEPPVYEVQRDPRPPHSAKVRKIVKGVERLVPDPKRRPAGLDREHPVMVSGPAMRVNVTEARGVFRATGRDCAVGSVSKWCRDARG